MALDLGAALSAISVIFGVAAAHMGSANTKIQAALDLPSLPAAQKEARKTQKRVVLSTFWVSALPSVLILLTLGIAMLPQVVSNILVLSFQLWDLELLPTLFQRLFVLVLFYFVASLTNAVKLLNKSREYAESK